MTHDAEWPTMLSPEDHAITTQLAQWVVVGLSVCAVTLFGAIVTLAPAAEKSELVRELVSKIGWVFPVVMTGWAVAVAVSIFYYTTVLDRRKKRASPPKEAIDAGFLRGLWAAVVSYLTSSWVVIVRGLLLVAALLVVGIIAIGSWDLKTWLDGITPPQP